MGLLVTVSTRKCRSETKKKGLKNDQHRLGHVVNVIVAGQEPGVPVRFFIYIMIKKPLFIACLTVFIDMIGVGIFLAIIPVIFISQNVSPSNHSFNISIETGYILLGLIIGSYSFAQFFSAPVLGQLSDHYGRKKILVASFLGTALSHILFAIGLYFGNIPILFISQIVNGITGSNMSVAKASVADITDKKDLSKNFGLLGAIYGIGFISGPFLGGLLSNSSFVPWFNITTPFWFASGLSFLSAIIILFVFAETLKERSQKPIITWTQPLKNIARAFSFPKLRIIFISEFLFHAGFTFFGVFFSVILIRKFGFAEQGIGNFYGYIGAWIIFTQLILTRILSRWLREEQILSVALVFLGIAVYLFLLPSSWLTLLFIAPLIAIFNGLSHSNLSGLLSRITDDKMQGEVMGVNTSVQSLAQSIPPLLAGYIAATFSSNTPILISSVLIVLGGVCFIIFYTKTEL